MSHRTGSWRSTTLVSVLLALLLSHPAPAAAQPTPDKPAIDRTVARESEPAGDAQAPRAPTITLRAVLRRAKADPPTVLRAQAAHARARAELGYARDQWYPSLIGEGRYGYTYDNRLVLPGVPRIDSESLEARGSVGLEWNALDAARSARIDQAESSLQASAHALQSAEQAAMLAAAELFFQARAARELVLDAELSLGRREQQQRATTELVQAGTRSPVDVQRAEIEVTSARYLLELRRNEERSLLAALAAALGRGPDEWVVPAEAELATLESATSPAAVRALATRDSPEAKRLDAQVEAAHKAHDAAVFARLPTLGVAATGSLSYLDVRRGLGIDGHQFGAAVGAFVRFAGLDPAVWARADVASAEVAEAERARAALHHRLGADAVAAFYALERTRIERARADAMLQSAARAREAQHGRYAAGVSSLLELLDAEELEQEARLRRIEARRDAAISLARLLATCGQLQP